MLFQLLSFLCVVSSALGDHWGVIVAGSNTYGNYRHQADACHAYQILHKNGIPDNRIIVMMYDDIANNPQNPTKGIIINKPNGPDVYKGVPKDYIGKDVTADKFLKVIQGDTTAGGKVLNSGPDDNVFIYFTDHGAPGLVAFPSTTLKATDFVNAIKKMSLKKMFKKMAIYIEACESGSMFDNLLPTNLQVYATTAANPRESSYAFYYDATRRTYLGDEYSINWMEDSDVADMKTETLNEQFIITRNKTKGSHVMQYGDNSIQDTVIGAFQGNVVGFTPRMPSRNTKSLPAMCSSTHDAVRSENVKIATLQRNLESENDAVLREQISNELNQELRRREEVDQVFHEVARRVTGSSFEASRMISNRHYNSIPFECYNPLIDFVQENCFFLPQDEWASSRMHVLVKLCEEGYSSAAITAALSEVCSPQMKANLL